MARIKVDEHSSRKDIIVSKAASLFREKGYKATSMRELADAVGVEAASLYNHIHSKTEILHVICFNVANRFMSHMESIELENVSAIIKVEKLLRFHINEMLHQYEEVYVSDREWKHLTDPYLSNFQNQRRTYRKRFAAIIEKGIVAGEIKSIDAPFFIQWRAAQRIRSSNFFSVDLCFHSQVLTLRVCKALLQCCRHI